MDQWTAKSVNLLSGRKMVLMASDSPANSNTGDNYDAFCEEIDSIAKLINCSGQEAEERLFSQGGRPRWAWREYVLKNWQPPSHDDVPAP
jgi:hypothetical protein